MKKVVVARKKEDIETMELWLTEEGDEVWLRAQVGSLMQIILVIRNDGNVAYPDFSGNVKSFLGCGKLGPRDK